MAHGGRIVVSGIGSSENDEFMLNLLNEQVRITALVLGLMRIPAFTTSSSALRSVLTFSDCFRRSEQSRRYGIQLYWPRMRTRKPYLSDF